MCTPATDDDKLSAAYAAMVATHKFAQQRGETRRPGAIPCLEWAAPLRELVCALGHFADQHGLDYGEILKTAVADWSVQRTPGGHTAEVEMSISVIQRMQAGVPLAHA